MGAVDFTTYALGKTMSQAYSNAVEDAEYDSGHDAYNGTISTTEGFADATKDLTKLLERKREGSVTWRTSRRDDEGRLIYETIDKRLADMTEKEWFDHCVNGFKEEAHSCANKWDVCWGALLGAATDKTNRYVFAGIAAC